jgi:SNF2 family DNA or RNA helicase
VFQTRHVPLTADQTKHYKAMMTALRFQHANGEVTAVNEAVKAGKLVQIACGVAYDENGEEVTVGALPRLEVTREIIEEAAAKTIVFVPFVSSVNYVADYLRSHGITVECIYGEVPKGERDRIFKEFQTLPDPKVIVAQPAAMSHGLTLVAANTIVWYAPIFSNDVYVQACARITRPGQKLAQLIVHIEGSPIEKLMYTRLQTKQKMQGVLLSLVEDARVPSPA